MKKILKEFLNSGFALLFLYLFSELLSCIKCLIKPEFSCELLKGFVDSLNILNIMDKQLLPSKHTTGFPRGRLVEFRWKKNVEKVTF